MKPYEITIENRVYRGKYQTAANAVFGAMRKRENELWHELGYAESREALARGTTIHVSRVPAAPVKIQRIH